MLRRTSQSLMLRRTQRRLAGDHVVPVMDPKKDPGAEIQIGLLGYPLQGSLAMFRLIDPKWILNRLVSLGRDGYIAGWTLWSFLWTMYWYVPQTALWGDGKPPRKVDWNAGKAGALPKDFKMTQL
jgi:hypothetical protein